MNLRLLQRDDSCPNGGVFYSCHAGFVGCCLVEACNPGIGCPEDKNTTPNDPPLSITTTTTSAPITTPISSTPTAKSFVSTIATVSTYPLSSSIQETPSARSSAPAAISEGTQGLSGDSMPTAAIVGGVLGGIILITVIAGLFFCMRRRRRTKIYKAATYPSPHVGSDMSPQLPDYREPKFTALLGTKQRYAHHIDSREVMPMAEMGETQPTQIVYAELPASNDSIRNV